MINAQAVVIGGSGIATFTLSGTGVLNQLGTNTGGANGRDVLVVGNNDASVGTFNQNGGTVNIANGLLLADKNNATNVTTGTYTITAGVADLNATTLGLGNATFNLDGGTVQEVSAITTRTGASVGTRTFNFNGGLITAGASTTAWFEGATAANVKAGGAKIDTNGFNITIGQVLSHDAGLGPTPDGGLVKSGAGQLLLTGVNSFTGNTAVTGGSLIIGNTSALGAPENYLTPTVLTLSGMRGRARLARPKDANLSVARRESINLRFCNK